MDPALAWVWDAYQALAGDRSDGGRTPFTAIDCYATRYGVIGGQAFERLHRLIIGMDGELEKWVAEKAAADRERQGGNGGIG